MDKSVLEPMLLKLPASPERTLKVRTSSIKNANMGLFSTVPFLPGATVVYYVGIYSKDKRPLPNDYIIQSLSLIHI